MTAFQQQHVFDWTAFNPSGLFMLDANQAVF
jgi:hypothetical protein